MRTERSTNYILSLVFLTFLAIIFVFVPKLSKARDTLKPGEVLLGYMDFLESQNKYFELGVFYSDFPFNHYLSIRSTDIAQKTVWVVNRENSLNVDTIGYLNFTKNGYLIIGDEKETSITLNPANPARIATLLDSGNFILKNSAGRIVWQSFDSPTDTILPGMRFGVFDLNLKKPRKVFLRSWVSPKIPTAGAFTLGIDPENTKRITVWRRDVPYWRNEIWNETSSGYFPFGEESFDFKFVSNENESYFSYSLSPEYKYAWIELTSMGSFRYFVGGIGSPAFNVSGQSCELFSGKKGVEDSMEGCVLERSKHNWTNCIGDDFEFESPRPKYLWDSIFPNISLSLTDCEEKCRNNCSCTAYNSAFHNGSGCKFSFRRIIEALGEQDDFYVRKTRPNNIEEKLKVILPVSISSLLALLCLLFFIWKKYYFEDSKNKQEKKGRDGNQVGRDTHKFLTELEGKIAAMDEDNAHTLMINGNTDHELPLFSFSTIETATGHFSEANKLGRGGFGPVYKGTLDDGQEIAVKRLSERSRQGTEEFKNEVVLISKVQHTNLVRLYGCCIKGEEKLLVYEYLRNKSLDTFLFDETKRLLLDWKLRMNIVEGIAQGLLYLHKYSRLKIIHRDLKTSNILLDNKMNPKISDFGTAKIFGDNESRANTRRIVGTYGYMSPEYAMDGLFSEKSDVFSFGVMILEIITGKRNTSFYQSNQSTNLVRYAWNLWKEKSSLELVDQMLIETCPTKEFERIVQIALLCVQENAAERPNMSDIVSMLGSDLVTLPEPKHSSLPILQTQNYDHFSGGTATISTIHAR